MTTANDVKISARDDLRAAYLLAFDSFSTDPSEVADFIGGNVRYGRELLGTLVTANLLTQTDSNGEDVWQVIDPGTYDDNLREDAVKTIDAWLDTNIPTKTATTTPKAGTKMSTKSTTPKNATGKCLCGCGENTAKSNYRPGHDARHAGAVARQIAGPKVTPAQATKALAVLPSEALRLKASAMADRLIEKAKPAAAKVETIKANAAKANETATSTAKPVKQSLTSDGKVITDGKVTTNLSKPAAKPRTRKAAAPKK